MTPVCRAVQPGGWAQSRSISSAPTRRGGRYFPVPAIRTGKGRWRGWRVSGISLGGQGIRYHHPDSGVLASRKPFRLVGVMPLAGGANNAIPEGCEPSAGRCAGAPPPDRGAKVSPIPEGSQQGGERGFYATTGDLAHCWHPSRMHGLCSVIRWCRRFAPQPPANGCEPSGFIREPGGSIGA